MPRIRSIYPEAWRSRKLAALSPAAERCWWRLQPACDDEGRCEDEPDVLCSELFKVMREVTPEDVDGWLWEMHEGGLITRYTVGGRDYLRVEKWSEFQHPQRKKASTIPPGQGASTRRVRDGSVIDPAPVISGGGGEREGSGYGAEGESEGEPRSHLAPVDNSAVAGSLLEKTARLKLINERNYPGGAA